MEKEQSPAPYGGVEDLGLELIVKQISVNLLLPVVFHASRPHSYKCLEIVVIHWPVRTAWNFLFA